MAHRRGLSPEHCLMLWMLTATEDRFTSRHAEMIGDGGAECRAGGIVLRTGGNRHGLHYSEVCVTIGCRTGRCAHCRRVRHVDEQRTSRATGLARRLRGGMQQRLCGRRPSVLPVQQGRFARAVGPDLQYGLARWLQRLQGVIRRNDSNVDALTPSAAGGLPMSRMVPHFQPPRFLTARLRAVANLRGLSRGVSRETAACFTASRTSFSERLLPHLRPIKTPAMPGFRVQPGAERACN